MNTCIDIVVTYNRKELLKENIEALIHQTYREHDILIVDNASTDGTKEMVLAFDDNRIIYENTGVNIGGAGGFAFGMNKAISLGYKYAWLMDDDSIPSLTALESLMEKAKGINNEFSFLAGLVYWINGELFDMNLPNYICKSKHEANYEMIRDYKLLQIQTCSFVGCFINLKIARLTALPIAEFFIYGDDIEYTGRLQALKPSYLDLDCTIIHKAPTNVGSDIVWADKERIERFYLQSRNGMYIARKNHKIISRIKLLGGRIKRIIKESPDCKGKRIWVLVKGTIKGFTFNPVLNYAECKSLE